MKKHHNKTIFQKLQQVPPQDISAMNDTIITMVEVVAVVVVVNDRLLSVREKKNTFLPF